MSLEGTAYDDSTLVIVQPRLQSYQPGTLQLNVQELWANRLSHYGGLYLVCTTRPRIFGSRMLHKFLVPRKLMGVWPGAIQPEAYVVANSDGQLPMSNLNRLRGISLTM